VAAGRFLDRLSVNGPGLYRADDHPETPAGTDVRPPSFLVGADL
jgi:hypothetical protein